MYMPAAMRAPRPVLTAILVQLVTRRSASIPTVDELGSRWIDPMAPVSVAAGIGAEQRDLGVVNNFYGAVGVAPQGIRPVDLFGVNSLELPPFAGCGADSKTAPFGCGGITIDGKAGSAHAVRWTAYEVRRAAPLPSGVVIESATRMPFEQNGVFWTVNMTNPTDSAVNHTVELKLPISIKKYVTVGNWVYDAPNDVESSIYTRYAGLKGEKGLFGCGSEGDKDQFPTSPHRPACGLWSFVGTVQPNTVNIPSRPRPSPPATGCSIAGRWIQESTGQTFGPIVENPHTGQFSWIGNPHYSTDGWNKFNGSVTGSHITLYYYRTYPHIRNPGVVRETGIFVDCDHVSLSDSKWHRVGLPPAPPPPAAQIPSAIFKHISIPANGLVTLRIALAIGENETVATAAHSAFAKDKATFDQAWSASRNRWEERWLQAFSPDSGFFSGSLPTVALDGEVGVQVERVYYMSVLTVLSQLRTNLPLIGPRVWPNGNGNVGHTTMGIGGSRSWWWDEALTSILLALLEPEGRPKTFQAWLAHDDHPGTAFGHGMGNGYAMDCEPIGSSSCTTSGKVLEGLLKKKSGNPGPEYGFYCYNPWAFYMAMGNHLRINNDSTFLHSRAANSSLTVAEALETIVTDFEEYLIPGTHLVDYGPAMDGFSPSYKHVMPGCSQGNNIYMLRDFASLQEIRGNVSDAVRLRKLADALSKDTLSKMYMSKGGKGWFNVIFPTTNPALLQVNEMRHVVDLFSVTFGLCGLCQDQPCGLSDQIRRELGTWFREESLTKSWIRATSPLCNCSNSWIIPVNTSASSKLMPKNDNETGVWPAYPTCHAGRPDHGSNGAYPSWPAFAVEALCYLDGNCSSAFATLASFAENTFEGPWGQAHEVPQQSSSPFQPFNQESAFKPTAGVTRYVAIEGGSFFDSIVRGVFGYHPTPMWSSNVSPQEALQAALVKDANRDRGFRGTLSNLRTPLGLVKIISSAEGLRIQLQSES